LLAQKLGRSTKPAKRVFDFVRELSNHLSARSVLYQQRVFATDTRASRCISHFNQQVLRIDVGPDQGNSRIDAALMIVNVAPRQIQFSCEGNVRCERPGECLGKHLIVIDQRHEGLRPGAKTRNAKQIFCGRVEFGDQQVFIQEDDGGIQALDNVSRGRGRGATSSGLGRFV
jgi:hypothetical protein